MISERLSHLSSSKELFDSEIYDYKQALVAAGYQANHLQYTINRSIVKINQRKRSRKIIWFNPPYSENVSTKIGSQFLKLLDKNFPKNNPLHKFFNRNTIKISYSCMPNMESFISNHNKNILQENTKNKESGCNCRKGVENCPLNGKCNTCSLVYKATVVDEDNESSEYIGLTSNSFKKRYDQHASSFNNAYKANVTGLSKHVWSLKNQNVSFNIRWEIAALAQPYNTESKTCHLCLTEKTLIVMANRTCSLNKRSEIMNKCRHKDKYLLKNYL